MFKKNPYILGRLTYESRLHHHPRRLRQGDHRRHHPHLPSRKDAKQALALATTRDPSTSPQADDSP